MTSQEFAAVDVLRLRIQEGWPDLPNLILNPNGEGGAWGWETLDSTGLGGTPGQSDYVTITAASTGTWLQYKVKADMPAGVEGYAFYRIDIPAATSGKRIRAVVNVTELELPPATSAWAVEFAAEDGSLLGQVLFPDPVAVGLNVLPTTVVPVGTTAIALAYAALEADTGHRVRFNDTWLIYGDTADVNASDPLTEPAWTDVLGSAANLTVTRDELNVGVLEATLFDSTLDPAEADLIRPGKRARLETLIDGEWKRLFTGKLEDPSAAYLVGDEARSELRSVRIQLVASDAAADLANEPRTEGVATIGELPYVLLGTDVPFNVNGSNDAINPETVVVVSENDQAKAIDQVAITRDSVLGYAWIDRNGVLQARDADAIAARYPMPLPNGTFDVDLSGWTGLNATLSRVTSPVHEGAGSCRITADAAGTIGARTPTGTAGFPVLPGAFYRLEAYNRRAAASPSRSSRVSLRWYDAAGVFLSATNGTAIANDATYQLREVEDVAPAGAAYLALSLDVLAVAGAGEIHNYDTVTLFGPAIYLDDSKMSDVDADFDVSRTFNTLSVELLRINPGTGETETVVLGPYVDPSARREWRAREATFKVQGIDEAAIDDYAAEILSRNAVPEKRINIATLPIRTLDELKERALLDLYDLAALSSVAAKLPAQISRITSVKHRITIKQENGVLVNRWWMDLGFTTDGSVAAPQYTPNPSPGGGRTLAELLRPVGEVSMWYGAKADCPAGWLVMDGSAFDGGQYPLLADLLGGTVLPDMTDRLPIGAGTKALGSSGGAPTVTLVKANLPTTDSTSSATGTNANRVARGTATSSGDVNLGSSTPVNILNPWRSVWFIIRAA